MYHETKVIDGLLHWRSGPSLVWQPYVARELTSMYRSVLGGWEIADSEAAELREENERLREGLPITSRLALTVAFCLGFAVCGFADILATALSAPVGAS